MTLYGSEGRKIRCRWQEQAMLKYQIDVSKEKNKGDEENGWKYDQ